jgi:hypothetical protein
MTLKYQYVIERDGIAQDPYKTNIFLINKTADLGENKWYTKNAYSICALTALSIGTSPIAKRFGKGQRERYSL